MKIKIMLLSGLIVVLLLSTGYENSSAGPKAGISLAQIGVVNVRRVFRDCKRNAQYRSEALAEQSKWQAEQEKLQRQLEALQAGLKPLKPGSSDHLAQVKQLLEKQAELQTLREFNKQQRALRDQRWTEDIYQEILRVTRELAEQKGLELVFEKNEPQFPSASADELMMNISTHKLLYSGGCLDITEEVIARLDAGK